MEDQEKKEKKKKKEDFSTFWEGGTQHYEVPILAQVICKVSMILVKILTGQDRVLKFS